MLGRSVTAVAPLPTWKQPFVSRDTIQMPTGTYDDNVFVGVVQVLWPELRVNDLALEVLNSRDFRRHSFAVIVVSCAKYNEAGAQILLTLGCVDFETPILLICGPIGRQKFVAVVDVFVDTESVCGISQVLLDGCSICHCAILLPWEKLEAKCVHVRIATDTGIAEEIPSATERVSSLKDCI